MMRKPVENLLTVRHSIIKERLTHMPEEHMIRELNHAATRMLATKIFEIGKFNLENITQEELKRARQGFGPFREYLLDEYHASGVEYYEGRVYVFTANELNDYVDSVVNDAIKERLDFLLHSLNKYKG